MGVVQTANHRPEIGYGVISVDRMVICSRSTFLWFLFLFFVVISLPSPSSTRTLAHVWRHTGYLLCRIDDREATKAFWLAGIVGMEKIKIMNFKNGVFNGIFNTKKFEKKNIGQEKFLKGNF